MACDAFEHTERKRFLSFSPVVRFAAALFGGRAAAGRALPLDALSDHLKRDIGFMDGRDAFEDDGEAMAGSRRLVGVDELPRF